MQMFLIVILINFARASAHDNNGGADSGNSKGNMKCSEHCHDYLTNLYESGKTTTNLATHSCSKKPGQKVPEDNLDLCNQGHCSDRCFELIHHFLPEEHETAVDCDQVCLGAWEPEGLTCSEHCEWYLHFLYIEGETETNLAPHSCSKKPGQKVPEDNFDLCNQGDCVNRCFELIHHHDIFIERKVNCHEVCRGSLMEPNPIEDAKAVEKPKAIEEAHDSNMNAEICTGYDCCRTEDQHAKWVKTKNYCNYLEANGECGGCLEFHIDANSPHYFCCIYDLVSTVLI